MRLLKEIFESWEWEWDFSRKFLRVENENESSHRIFWELRMRMRVLMIKLRVEIENESLNFSRMSTIIWESRLRMRLSNFREWEPLFESRDLNQFEQNQSLDGVEEKMSALWNSFARIVAKHVRQPWSKVKDKCLVEYSIWKPILACLNSRPLKKLFPCQMCDKKFDAKV